LFISLLALVLSNTYAAESQAAPPATLPEPPPDAPLFSHDPFGWLHRPSDNASDAPWYRGMKLGVVSYTLLDEYATNAPGSPRHNEADGRLDFNGSWNVYRRAQTSGSIHMLLRSGVNIGISQSFNLNNELGSSLITSALQAGGPKQVSLNMLYWEQDLFAGRLLLYIGHIHPNQHIGLSYLNDDETFQFLAASYDGNMSNPYSGAYTTGAAIEYRPKPHIFVHTVAADTEGSAYTGPLTLADGKLYEALEAGWTTGSYGEKLRNYRVAIWRADTKSNGSGDGAALGSDHEFSSGWAPFGRFGFGTRTGTTIKQVESIGLTHVRPFGRLDDMFGIAMTWSRPSHGLQPQEQLFETFYRARLTHSMELGPDVEILGHPAYNLAIQHTMLFGVRMRIIF
jgi:porin